MSTQRIPAGVYRGKGIAGTEQFGQTSNGNDQIVLDLMLLDTGEKVSTFLVFSDKSAPYSIDRLKALGWSNGQLDNLDGIDLNEVDVEVKYEMYQGQEKMKVQILTGGGVVLKDKLDDKGKRAFAAKYAALAKGSAAPQASRPAPARGAATAPAGAPNADDLPF
jgi:hypothetical protein